MVQFMSDQQVSLAIETSSRHGSVAMGRGDALLATAELGQQRHAVGLMPAVDAICREHDLAPRDIQQVSVSIGPGSFTGLRIAVTAAKMLGHVTGAKLVAVPTLDVVIQNMPVSQDKLPGAGAVMLNAKRGQCFTGIYEQRDEAWVARSEAALMTPAQVCEALNGQGAVVGDHLPEHDWPAGITVLDESLAVPRAEVVWQLGRERAARGQFVTPLEMVPFYVRLPEAEEVWQQKQAGGAQRKC